MLARRLLQILLIALGAAAVMIGTSIYLAGPSWTGGTTESLVNALLGGSVMTPPYWRTVDSEFRFYAPFFITYGGVLIWTALTLRQHLSWVPGLAALFFVGGLGRLISFFVAGAPHPAFIVLMAIELILPVVVVALWWLIERRPQTS